MTAPKPCGCQYQSEECPYCGPMAAHRIADPVNEPPHYGGSDNPHEVFKVVEAWGLDHDAYLFNVIKYVARADKKGKQLEDLRKARVYLDRRIRRLEDGA